MQRLLDSHKGDIVWKYSEGGRLTEFTIESDPVDKLNQYHLVIGNGPLMSLDIGEYLIFDPGLKTIIEFLR